MSIGMAALGAVALALVVVLGLIGRLPMFRNWLALFAGLTLGGGILAGVVSKIVNVIGNLLGHALGIAAGVAVSIGGITLAVLATVMVVHHMHPKKGTGGHKWLTPLMAFCLPAIFIAAGGIFAQSVGWLSNAADLVPTLVGSFA